MIILSLTTITESDSKQYLKSNSMSVTLGWSFETQDYISSSPSVLDIENDGLLEIVIGSTDDYLYCLDNSGNEIWSFQTQDDIRLTPAIFDSKDWIQKYNDFRTQLIIANKKLLYAMEQ